jgi:hypothetical protein
MEVDSAEELPSKIMTCKVAQDHQLAISGEWDD